MWFVPCATAGMIFGYVMAYGHGKDFDRHPILGIIICLSFTLVGFIAGITLGGSSERRNEQQRDHNAA